MDSDQSSEIEGLFLKEVTKEDDAHQKSSGISDNLYSKECGVHGLLVFVMDTPVQFGTNSRAFYSTPHGLAVGPSENREEGLGVWCTVKTIPKGVLFGPIEGSVPVEKGSVEKLYTQMVQERNLAKLGAFDESKSNWMRFVNFAKTPAERNLTVSQYNGKFYYKVCQSIEPAHELLIWYGEDEAASKSMQKQNLLKEKQENVNTCGEYYDQQIKQEYKAEVQENQDVAHPECCGGLAESEHNPGDIEQIQSCHNGDFREPSLVSNKPFDSLNENAGRSLENEETLSCCLSSLMNTKNSTLCSQLYSSQKTHENRDAGARDSSLDQIGSTRDQKHFKCEYCGKLFLQKADVMIHLLTHTDSVNEVFQANGICDSEMSSSLNGYLGDGREEAFEGILVDGLKLPNHILFQDKPSLFGQGMECNETSKLENEHGSKDETMLNFTSSAYDKEKHFDCEYCTRSFLRKEQLMTHRRTHTGEKPFACEQCGRAFAEKSNLNEHRRTHTGIRPHSCSWCGKAFYRRSHLKVHLRRHTGEKPYTCDVCRHTFVDTSSLQRHKCRSDSVNEAFLEPEIHNTLKPTTANGFRSVEIETMSGDILVNSRKQLNNILSQDKPSIFNETLNRGNSKLENKLDDKDERVLEFTSSLHDKEKHFDCEYCTRSFLRKEQLMTHRRTHTGEKPFACEQCGRAFAEKSNLNEHRRTHTGIRPHSCSWCGKAFYRRSHLKVHLRRHTGEKPYTCDVCRHTFVDTSSLQRHKCRSGSVNDAFMEPEICDTQKNTSANGSRGVESEALSGDILVNCLKQLSNILSENKPSIFDETLNKDSPKPESSLDDRGERVLEFTSSICDKEKHFNCEYCTQSFLRKEQLMMHRRTHTGEKPFACEQCGRAFAEKSNLNEHRRTHTGIRPYSCSLCNKAFYRSSHLKVHLRRHTGEKPYKCDVCQYTFVDSSSLRRHRRFPSACYKTNQMDSAAAMQNKPMKEHICHSNADTIQGEDVDIKRDADETKQAVEDLAYLCPEEFPNQNCEKTSAVEILSGSSFTRISDHSLDKSHQDQLPPGEKYFKCEYCGRRFLRKAQLTMHRRVHTGEKPFLCHDCGRGFAEKSNLNDHRRTHTGERPYECTFCVKAFHRSTHLKVHLRRHTGEKPYKCEDCKKTFVDSSSLQRHRRFPSDSCSLLGKQHSEKEVCDMEILLDNNSGCNSHSSSSEQKTVPNIYFGICKREKSEHFNYPLISESGRYVKNNPNALFDGLLLDPVQPALKQMEERENQQISNVQ